MYVCAHGMYGRPPCPGPSSASQSGSYAASVRNCSTIWIHRCDRSGRIRLGRRSSFTSRVCAPARRYPSLSKLGSLRAEDSPSSTCHSTCPTPPWTSRPRQISSLRTLSSRPTLARRDFSRNPACPFNHVRVSNGFPEAIGWPSRGLENPIQRCGVNGCLFE